MTVLTNLLGLDFHQSTWLEQNRTRAYELLNYLQQVPDPQASYKALGHLNRLMADPYYASFVQQYAQTGGAVMWWENYSYLASFGGTSFGNWAINYLIQHPEVPFHTFENWFLKTPEYTAGGEPAVNPDDITYEEPVVLTTLPSLADFEAAFPKEGTSGSYTQMSAGDVYELVGGSLYQNYLNYPDLYGNACSIRGSRGLLYSGITIPVLKYNGSQRTQKGGDNKNYVLDAVSFNKFMKDKFGEATHKLEGADANDPTKVAELLNGKNGIYVIVNNSSSTAGYTGHADMILNGECIGGAYTLPEGGVKSIKIWELE